MCAQASRRPERAAAAAPTCQPGGTHLPTRCRRWLRALFGTLWPAVAGSLQPDAAGRGGAPPRRQPAINAFDEPRAARWRSARGQRGARASVAPQPRPYSAAARAVLLSLTRRLCLQPDPAIRSRQCAPCIPSHGARPWETAPPFLNTIRTRPLGPWPNVQAWPKMTGPCPDRP